MFSWMRVADGRTPSGKNSEFIRGRTDTFLCNTVRFLSNSGNRRHDEVSTVNIQVFVSCPKKGCLHKKGVSYFLWLTAIYLSVFSSFTKMSVFSVSWSTSLLGFGYWTKEKSQVTKMQSKIQSTISTTLKVVWTLGLLLQIIKVTNSTRVLPLAFPGPLPFPKGKKTVHTLIQQRETLFSVQTLKNYLGTQTLTTDGDL